MMLLGRWDKLKKSQKIKQLSLIKNLIKVTATYGVEITSDYYEIKYYANWLMLTPSIQNKSKTILKNNRKKYNRF
jgi:hypothetical protein